MTFDSTTSVNNTNLKDDERLSEGTSAVSSSSSDSGIARSTLARYTYESGLLTARAAEHKAQLTEIDNKIKFLNGLLQDINKLSNEKGLDISKDAGLQEKLKIAKEMGISLDENKFQYSAEARDNLKQTLDLAKGNLTPEMQMKVQELQRLSQLLDQWLTFASNAVKTEDKLIRSSVEKIGR